MNDVGKTLREVGETLRVLSREVPEEAGKFREFVNAVLREGTLDLKTKELIAVSIAVHAGCERCIYIHVRKALEAGASREEILEAAYVAVLMGGGPALMHFVPLLRALEELST